MARPLEFCQPIADGILERISQGEDLTKICTDGDLPHLSTIYKWLHGHPHFAEAYARAREVQGEFLAAKALAIATRTHVELPNGMFVAADPQRDRLAVDTLKWSAAHLNQKTWGEKQQLELSGGIKVSDASEEDMIEHLLVLLASGRVRLPEGVEIVEIEGDDFDHDSLA